MKVTRIFDVLDYSLIKHPKEDALACKKNGNWIKYSTKAYKDFADKLSYAFLAKGIKKGDKIATISNNRPEWNFVDIAISQIGAVHVPVYPTISEDDYKYILKHSDTKLVFISDKQLEKKLLPIINEIHVIKDVYSFDKLEQTRNWQELIDLGDKSSVYFKQELEKIKKNIQAQDLASIIYTSGTTGLSKGVMLNHQNLVSNFIATSGAHEFGKEHRVLSFLPLSHVYERMMNYHFQYKGMGIYYAESLATIADNLKEVKPHLFNTVPRLLENVYDKIQNKARNLSFIKRKIFNWAVNLGLKYDFHDKKTKFYKFQLKIAKKLVFSKWKEALGGNVDIIVSGGAALQPRLARVFAAAGVNVLEGYGLTETSPVIAVNNYTTKEMMIGTVGPILPGITVKIADDGEILCKGPNVMLGYYKNPDMTKEVIDNEGWFHTGDIGELVDDKYLKITDRKKEVFKTSSGKYIAPQKIENIFKESPFIEQIMVVGENQKFASAIISPNFNELKDWIRRNNIAISSNQKEDIINHPAIQQLYSKEVRKINKTLGQIEEIKRFRIIKDEWTPNTGELSPTLKLKRRVLLKNYNYILDEIYNTVTSDITR